jgi:hypothetical protein
MPNRFIKESICTSETIDKLSAEEERLFYRLIVNCDDYGRMDARPEIIRSKCFPWKVDKIKIKDIELWLSRLHVVELIILYEHYEKRFLEFLTWHEHQQIRANKSKYPGPNDEGSILLSFDINCNQIHGDIAKCDRTRIRIYPNTPIVDLKEKGGMGEKGKHNPLVIEFTENEDLRRTIQDFIEMRVKIKKPATDRALKSILKRLTSFTNDTQKQIEILENAIVHCWQDIYPLKDNKSDNPFA